MKHLGVAYRQVRDSGPSWPSGIINDNKLLVDNSKYMYLFCVPYFSVANGSRCLSTKDPKKNKNIEVNPLFTNRNPRYVCFFSQFVINNIQSIG
jgi:hypothetical protein